MNAHRKAVECDRPEVQASTPTPADLKLVVRDRRFGRERKLTRWWVGGDPIATAWSNCLSATFPRGEAFFIKSIKVFRDEAPPALAEEIRTFIAQEVNHSREHLAFNRAAEEAGYDLSEVDRRVVELLDLTKDRPPIVNLAATMALEHYTAMMAYEFLTNPRHFEGAEPESVALWHWHSIEEIEHKAVAYDTWLYATRDWNRLKRWALKTVMMLLVTRRFLVNRIKDALDLLAQDGFTGWRTKLRLFRYLLISPGILRRIFPAWIAYFMPGFHPWNHDDRALIEKADRLMIDPVQ